VDSVGFGDDNVCLTVKQKHVTNRRCDFICVVVHWKTIRRNSKEFDSVQLTPNRSNNLL
jgi:hypothetical protein